MKEFNFDFVKKSHLLEKVNLQISKISNFYQNKQYNEMFFNIRRDVEKLAALLVEQAHLVSDENQGFGLSGKIKTLRQNAVYPATIMRLFDRLRTYGSITVHSSMNIDEYTAQLALQNYHDLLVFLANYHDGLNAKYADILLKRVQRKKVTA